MLAYLGVFGMAIALASAVQWPVRYINEGNPQMRKADLVVAADKDWATNGWELELEFDKRVRDVEGVGTKRETSSSKDGKTFTFTNRNHNSVINGQIELMLRFHVNEQSEVRRGKYAKLVSARIRSTSDKDHDNWMELCESEEAIILATQPPAPPPCTDFYEITDINDSRDGGRCSRQYRGNIKKITFTKPVVGFKFDVTFNKKAVGLSQVHFDNLRSVQQEGSRTYRMTPWDNTAQIKSFVGEDAPRWDSKRNNFGVFQIGYVDDICNDNGPKVTQDLLPVPVKIVVHHNEESVVMCQG